MSGLIYVPQMYAEGAEVLGDCLGIYHTLDDAIDAALIELGRVRDMPIAARDPQMDWAVSFDIKAYPADDDEAEGWIVRGRTYLANRMPRWLNGIQDTIGGEIDIKRIPGK